ncbi:MAG: CCA tRNA nucleotidyltransferase [Halobacteriales archaeon]|nr:CCA tRNA nucleotidyltransferase [Halobacteriales archaeon]
MTDTSLESVVERIDNRVTPTADERERLHAVVDRLRARALDAINDLGVEADVRLVGSTARGTWLAGDRDIDLFVRFPPDTPRTDLERDGLRVGHSVIPDGHEEFAEHPYVKGEVEGFAVDCVPCFAVDSAGDIQSAVDRTPFHTEYLEARLDDDLRRDARVAKTFLKGIGAYGSDLRTRGFAGYLAELLVLEHGGFIPLVRAATDWHPPVHFDPEGHATSSFEDPLVVIDPTDPDRNVAASLSAENLARLIHYSRDLCAEPREELFEPRSVEPMGAAAVRETVSERGTHPVAVRFDAPDIVEDQLYPQLEKSLSGLESELQRRGFDPLRSTCVADETAALLIECQIPRLPAVERHEGPPVGVRDHAEGFYATYADGPETGPYLDGDRYVVERERDYRTPEAFIQDALFSVALGPAIERALELDYTVLAGGEIAILADEFGTELREYFSPHV